jgi:hypothetical protein
LLRHLNYKANVTHIAIRRGIVGDDAARERAAFDRPSDEAELGAVIRPCACARVTKRRQSSLCGPEFCKELIDLSAEASCDLAQVGRYILHRAGAFPGRACRCADPLDFTGGFACTV